MVIIMKDNFLLKKNQQEVFDELTDEEAGRLIKGIFSYVSTGESNLKGSFILSGFIEFSSISISHKYVLSPI